MDNKITQKSWIGVVFWAGLLGAVVFTSNALIEMFLSIIQFVFQGIQGEIGNLFKDFGLLFITLLGIGLLFLLILTWLELVSLTFAVGSLVYGAKEEGEEEEEDDLAYLPGKVARYLAFTWGLFYILFLILPLM